MNTALNPENCIDLLLHLDNKLENTSLSWKEHHYCESLETE